jgi:hypothetical protein
MPVGPKSEGYSGSSTWVVDKEGLPKAADDPEESTGSNRFLTVAARKDREEEPAEAGSPPGVAAPHRKPAPQQLSALILTGGCVDEHGPLRGRD